MILHRIPILVHGIEQVLDIDFHRFAQALMDALNQARFLQLIENAYHPVVSIPGQPHRRLQRVEDIDTARLINPAIQRGQACPVQQEDEEHPGIKSDAAKLGCFKKNLRHTVIEIPDKIRRAMVVIQSDSHVVHPPV